MRLVHVQRNPTKIDKVQRKRVDLLFEMFHGDCIDTKAREASCKVTVYELYRSQKIRDVEVA